VTHFVTILPMLLLIKNDNEFQTIQTMEKNFQMIICIKECLYNKINNTDLMLNLKFKIVFRIAKIFELNNRNVNNLER